LSGAALPNHRLAALARKAGCLSRPAFCIGFARCGAVETLRGGRRIMDPARSTAGSWPCPSGRRETIPPDFSACARAVVPYIDRPFERRFDWEQTEGAVTFYERIPTW
jgi:hypothetical protein